MVRRVVVPLAHQSSNPRFDTCMSRKRRNILSVGGEVSVDSEASVVTLSISRPDPSAQSLGGAHRDRVCVHVFIGVNVCAFVSICVVLCLSKKITRPAQPSAFVLQVFSAPSAQNKKFKVANRKMRQQM
jgi:hypothetical protein